MNGCKVLFSMIIQFQIESDRNLREISKFPKIEEIQLEIEIPENPGNPVLYVILIVTFRFRAEIHRNPDDMRSTIKSPILPQIEVFWRIIPEIAGPQGVFFLGNMRRISSHYALQIPQTPKIRSHRGYFFRRISRNSCVLCGPIASCVRTMCAHLCTSTPRGVLMRM